MKKLIILSFCLLIGSAYAQQFTASLSKKTVATNETFRVDFKLEGGQSNDFNLPEIKNLQVISGPNPSRSTTIINNQVTQSMAYSYILRSTQVGTFRIGSASVKVDGKTLKTDPITVKVVKGQPQSATTPNSQRQSNNIDKAKIDAQLKDAIFLRTLVNERSVYQGEQITATYKLYINPNLLVRDLARKGNPKQKGFWIENVELTQKPANIEVYKDQRFRTLLAHQDVLFPQYPGQLEIAPMVLDAVIGLQVQRRRRSIFDSFFPQEERYPYEIRGPRVKLNIKPLPANAPEDYIGLVGKLNLDVSLDKTEQETGEAITLKMVLSGQGNIRQMKNPELNLPPDFEVYEPNVSEKTRLKGGIFGGERVYEYLIIPRNPGTYDLDQISVSYFDPDKGKYQQIKAPAFQLTITGDPQLSSTVEGSGNTGEEVQVLNESIRYIHAGDAELVDLNETFANSTMFWILFLLPFGLFPAFLVLYRKKQAMDADTVGIKQRKATKIAQQRLKTAQAYLAEGEEKKFYDETGKAIWGYLGDRLNINPAELNRSHVNERLDSSGVNQALIDRLIGVLDTCEMALFAPVSGDQGVQETYQEAVSVLSSLEEEIKSVN
ncbi:MAG: BatD family protein [Bacteroidota bacterium]